MWGKSGGKTDAEYRSLLRFWKKLTANLRKTIY